MTVRQGADALSLQAPDGWQRQRLGPGSWNWTVADNPPYTYVLRVGVLAAQDVSTADAVADRVAALTQGTTELDVEARSEDSLSGTYVSEEHRRVTYERWVTAGESPTAYAVVSVTGREADRDGLQALLQATVDSLRT